MRSSPRGPGDHEGRLDPALLETCGDPADFLDRPAYQRCSRASSFLFWGEVRRLACSRTSASMANASITSDTCRCQPCHERVSLCVSPNSVFASQRILIAQRCPSTRTSVSIGVPAGTRLRRTPDPHRDVAPDQQPACPQAGQLFVLFLRLKIRQLDIGPIIQARPLGAIPADRRFHVSASPCASSRPYQPLAGSRPRS